MIIPPPFNSYLFVYNLVILDQRRDFKQCWIWSKSWSWWVQTKGSFWWIVFDYFLARWFSYPKLPRGAQKHTDECPFKACSETSWGSSTYCRSCRAWSEVHSSLFVFSQQVITFQDNCQQKRFSCSIESECIYSIKVGIQDSSETSLRRDWWWRYNPIQFFESKLC